jgi:putative toxin-antitoxin system antitoxin component (TIGR02293 family)
MTAKTSAKLFFCLNQGAIQLPKTISAWKMIRKGLDFSVAEALAQHLGTDLEVVLDVIGLTGGTVSRRKRANTLTPQESDRLYRVLKVTAHAERVLDDPQKAKVWLFRNNRVLGGQQPFSLLDNGAGAEAVEEVLIQIDYGVYS